MADILNIPTLGRLEIVEIYDYYDQPVLFSCKDTEDNLYLVVAADENDQYETWLYAKVSVDRLNLIQSDKIDLHDAFADTEDGSVLQVKFPYDETPPLPDLVKSSQIPDDMLPDPGEYLDLKPKGPPLPFTITGALIGVLLRSKIFEIETVEQTYTGYIADEAFETVKNATLSREYTAEIQEVVQRSGSTDKNTNPTYLLLSLN